MTTHPQSPSYETEQPLVSCLMVTANRKQLMKRALRCFKNQHYQNKELVIIDDGEQDLSEVLTDISADQLSYLKLKKSADNTLGKLRNIALEKAAGDFLIQWDDDDWYHPDRIKIQAQYLLKGYDACCLSGALMHLDTPKFMAHPYVGILPDGIPGSIMHRKDSTIRYPHTRRAEDTEFLNQWMKKRYLKLPDVCSYLFLRAYHGQNTWEKKHFLRRIRNTPATWLQYGWYAILRNQLFDHPKFNLSEKEKESFQRYLEDSKQFGLI